MTAINPHTLNRWVAHFMPIVILAVLGLASWVFCALICVDYLAAQRKLKGTAEALLVVYAFLLVLLLISYVRVVWTINFNPGLVACDIGAGPVEKEKTVSESGAIVGSNERDREKQRDSGGDGSRDADTSSHIGRGRWSRASNSDAAVDGIPLESGEMLRAVPYASTISRSSRMGSRTPSPLPPGSASAPSLPPQAHINDNPWSTLQQPGQTTLISMPPPLSPHLHTSDYSISRPQSLAQWMLPKNLDEFYNMDAFICENDGLPRWCFHCSCWKPDRSHHCGELGRCVRKMDHFCPWVGGVVGETSFKFFYQTVCYGVLYCVYVLIVTAVMINDRGTKEKSIPSMWLVLLALACVFGLFCAGMAGTTTQFILRNTTTIDNISAATKVYQIAIYDPHATHQQSREAVSNPAAKRITFPDADPALVNIGVIPRRTFVIAKTEPGENPWRLEGRLKNFKEVMGEKMWDWFLPIKCSPCTIGNPQKDHEAGTFHREGMYKFNPLLMQRLRREYGISPQNESSS